ncbi:MAG: hypothetical protein LBF83_11950 [Spirochaetaceae bacterium]|jgi:hypothetical protein|nr:hypothetical protein [Spirochaetaceae bacterium]
MPITKAAAKKTAKSARKKVTQADILANFDKIQKTLDELAAAHEETEKTLNKVIGEISETRAAHKEAIRDIQAAHEETEKTLNKAIGGLSNTLGSLVEHVMTPDLPRKFKEFGFTFTGIQTVKWANGEGNIYTEIDGLLENGKQAVAVEVKTTLRRRDIDEHLERMEKVRKYAGEHGDNREFFGAMAAPIIGWDVKDYALSKGFFVIEPLGEDVKVTKPPSAPRSWSCPAPTL